MKNILKKSMPLVIAAAVLAMTGMTVSCGSSRDDGATMYERQQSNKAIKVKSNYSVRGNNKTNGHTTRSY